VSDIEKLITVCTFWSCCTDSKSPVHSSVSVTLEYTVTTNTGATCVSQYIQCTQNFRNKTEFSDILYNSIQHDMAQPHNYDRKMKVQNVKSRPVYADH